MSQLMAMSYAMACLRPCQKIVILLCVAITVPAFAQTPSPSLKTIFPLGCQLDAEVEVTIQGDHVGDTASLHFNSAGLQATALGEGRFLVTASSAAELGMHEVRVRTANGLSGPRPFMVSERVEVGEEEANDTDANAQTIQLSTVVNGRLQSGGDIDCYELELAAGKQVVLECWAHRIDSRLRAVLQVFGPKGRRIAVNRGFFGTDPCLAFRALEAGRYVISISDLVYSGGEEHYYRLDVDDAPRVVAAVPPVVQRDRASRVTLYGWNLRPNEGSGITGQTGINAELQTVEFDVVAEDARPETAVVRWLSPEQMGLDGFLLFPKDAQIPYLMSVTDVEVITEPPGEHARMDQAVELSVPSEVGGQLGQGNELDWYAIDVKRGEVLHLEAWGQRINSPVDLDLVVHAPDGQPLARFRDGLAVATGPAWPSGHFDPRGRWVAPQDGRYFILVRNLIGDAHPNPWRTYRLSVRREEPELSVVAMPVTQSRLNLNVAREGTRSIQLVAERSRGLDDSVRISAVGLPQGLQAEDIWLGPGVNVGQMVIAAGPDAEFGLHDVVLEASTAGGEPRSVRFGTLVRGGTPNGWSRFSETMSLAVVGESPIRVHATVDRGKVHHLYGKIDVQYSPGGVLDVAVDVERTDTSHSADVQLIGVGVPPQIENQTAMIPAGESRGHISFYLPQTLAVGHYSLAVQAQTTVSAGEGEQSVTVVTNSIDFEVQPPAFQVAVDPYAPRQIQRGETIQIKYTAKRINGFIGKIHTELATPTVVTDVDGLRGRGVTFVGQTEAGNVQVIANDNATLGRRPFLRLYAVGVREDEAVFHGSCFIDLEVVE